MDEQEYKKAYSEINNIRCVFEKALCSLACQCSKSQQFRLADRIAYGCRSSQAQQQCATFVEHLRKQTRFVFKLNEITGPLPHNKEIRVQNGGMLGLKKLVQGDIEQDNVEDIYILIQLVVKEYGDINKLPYDVLMQSVMSYKARPKRRPRK